MKRRDAAVVARPVRRPSRGPVGFAVRDARGRGGAYEIDETAGGALVFGSASMLHVSASGVLPAHFVVLPHDGLLVAASASALNPAVLNGATLPTTWTVLAVPSRIRLGAAAVDFFLVRESGTHLADQDVETTVADTGPQRALRPREGSAPTRVETGPPRAVRLVTPARPLPAVTPPPMQTPRRAITPAPRPPLQLTAFTARHVAIAAATHARTLWTSATMSTRVLLGVVALLLIFLIARSGESPRTIAAGVAPAAATPTPTGVPAMPVTVAPTSTATAASASPREPREPQ